MRRLLIWTLLGGVALAAGLVALGRAPAPRQRHADKPQARSLEKVRPLPAAPPPRPETIDWIAAGGGPIPELNPVSLEQDLALATEVLPGAGVVLFASGPDGADVQELDETPRSDPLRLALGELFSPRPGRDAHYRPARLRVDGPATARNTLETLGRALSGPPRPLLLYLASHGDMGETPRDNGLPLWGGTILGVQDVAEVLDQDRSGRRVRIVITACHAGGFAEIAFAGAQEGDGAAATDRCGLFATTWDLQASGCDPDPDRRRQEGYGLHFLHALHGQDRSGSALPSSEVDFDGSGVVSLLEAHTRARIASRSIDVPVTTSERWLRSVAPTHGPSIAVSLPEDDAVIAALAPALELGDDPAGARARLQDLERRIEEIDENGQAARASVDDLTSQLAAELLSRWPVLDDPWHPDHAGTMERSGDEIRRFLEESSTFAALRAAREQSADIAALTEPIELEAARVERVARALETRQLAAHLRARGGARYKTYERLLACERSAP